MNLWKRTLSLLLVCILTIGAFGTNVFGYTNISTGEGGGGTGAGSDDWKYTSATPGVRISIYWAD